MIRRRAVPSRDDDNSNSKYSKHPHPNRGGSEDGPIVPLSWVVGIVVVCLVAGVLQHQYHATRLRYPLAVLKGNKIAKGGPGAGDGGVQDQEDSLPLWDPNRKLHQRPGNLQPKSRLTVEEDIHLERDASGVRYHLVFSTDCSPYQHWQSYLVYYTAMKVRQPGHVTRIASGCGPEEAVAMNEWFQQDIQFMSPRRFHLQLTPHFSEVKNEQGQTIGDYKFFNKPFGLKYWMEHSPQLGWDEKTKKFTQPVQDDVVILIDPDMGLLRPITNDFSDERETYITENRRGANLITTKVGPGKPASQVYGFGGQWTRLDLEKIAGIGTPAKKVSQQDALLYYPVGPPYLATVSDMYNIAKSWCEFVPKTYEQYPHLLAEMFAFCIAAAHLELPHQMISSLMVSDAGSKSEGWPLVDKIPAEEVCGFAANPNHAKYAVPSVVHLCQRHAVGKDWFFSKRRIPGDVYDCEVPIFQNPPNDLAIKFDYQQFPRGQKKPLTKEHAVQHSFILCYVYSILNEAATFYKKNACAPESINLEKSRNLAEMFFSEEAGRADKKDKKS